MVRPAIRRFHGLMAMGSFSETELVEVIKHVRQTPPSVLLNEIRGVQYNLGLRPREKDARDTSSVGVGELEQVAPSPLERETIEQIDRLLFTDKRTTKSVAVQELTKALRSRYPAAVLPVFESKDGFARWLSALSLVVPLGEIMHAAARVGRSESEGDDWIQSDS